MKIRLGFVSNSSSSSFIIGLAVVKDMSKYKKYIEENSIDKDIILKTYKELKENPPWHIDRITDKEITLDSFDGGEVSIDTREIKDGTHILIYCFFGNEGDYAFMGQYEDGTDSDINYDIDFDFFDKTQQNTIDMFVNKDEAGLEKVEWTYGADRNG